MTGSAAGQRQWLITVVIGVTLFMACAIAQARSISARLDEAILLDVHEWVSQRSAQMVFFEITCVGSIPVVVLVAAILALVAYRRGDRYAARVLSAIVLADLVLNGVAKLIFQRQRPRLFTVVASPSTFSFPSGHTMAALAVYGTCALVLVRMVPSTRHWVMIVAPVLIVLIGLSRLVLGLHWPTDVVASYAIGLVLFATGWRLLHANRQVGVTVAEPGAIA